MILAQFAEKHRLRLKRAEDGGHVILGKFGNLYEHDSATLALLFMPDRPRLWSHAKRKLEAADFTIWQNGDEEGSALFDPTSPAQARIALKVVGVKRKRRQSPRQLANLRKTLDTRPSSRAETPISA